MPKASDYGKSGDDTALVPGTLIAYRHFGLNGITLTPMGALPMDTYAGFKQVFEARCHARYSAILPGPGCNCSMCSGYTFRPDHSAPEVNCKCGFYAHYSPDTDFYPTRSWSYPEQAMLRTVVEMSGTVVMGGLGVRAQKMAVKAMTVDWDKHNTVGVYTYSEVCDTVTRAAESAADLYGAEYYDTPEEMYAAFPQPDLSALGLEPAPPPKPERISFDGIGAILQPVTITINGTFTPGGILDEIFGSTQPPKRKPSQVQTEDASPIARAIEVKKNRPAPPGTGIDRRRRKL